MSGMEQLEACIMTVLTKLEGIEQRLCTTDMTRPMTAAELCERWRIESSSPVLKLAYLARRCRSYGLQALKGGDGWNALYRRADVLRAEEHAAGKIRGRKIKKGRKA